MKRKNRIAYIICDIINESQLYTHGWRMLEVGFLLYRLEEACTAHPANFENYFLPRFACIHVPSVLDTLIFFYLCRELRCFHTRQLHGGGRREDVHNASLWYSFFIWHMCVSYGTKCRWKMIIFPVVPPCSLSSRCGSGSDEADPPLNRVGICIASDSMAEISRYSNVPGKPLDPASGF